MKLIYKISIYSVFLFLIQSCKIYSFTGANINPEIRTVSVDYIYNESGSGPISVSDIFTETLKDKFINNTSLAMVNSSGDVAFSGVIRSYQYSIQAPTGSLSSDLRRITMSVEITFENKIEEENSFSKAKFTKYSDYSVSESLDAIENSIIEDLSAQLADEIFNKAFVNW